MGARGPKPAPSNVLALRGSRHLHQRPTGDTVEPTIEIPGCPKHLLPEARKEWKRISAELEQLGLVSRIDRTALALYCQEWAWWVWHDTALQRAIKIAEEREMEWNKAEADRLAGAEQRGEQYEKRPWTGGDGFMVPTPNGHLTYNPHWVARNKASLALDKFLASFGMSPSSRGRVSASSRQASLPGMEPAQGFNSM